MSLTLSGSNGLTFPDSSTQASGKQAVKAWVNFDGASGGTVAIRDSYNVTSITDNGTGDYTVNYTAALSNANYAILTTGSNTDGLVTGVRTASAAPTTTTARLFTTNTSFVSTDATYVHFAAIGA
mgnify:CR=1 FL=1